MCGIVGVWSTVDHNQEKVRIKSALKAIAHRGPDNEGIFVEPEHGLLLGHRRLSIQDLSEAGNQPMHSSTGRYVIVFNGEIYNFRELRKALEAGNQDFCGHSDTEIILAAVEKYGIEEAMQSFNGMFAFALYDRRQNTLHIARDRMGEKPLYLYYSNKRFVFCSELKGILECVDEPQAIDRSAVASYFHYGYFPVTETPFVNIKKLPPARLLTISSDILSGTSTTSGILGYARQYWKNQINHEDMPVDASRTGPVISLFSDLLRDVVRQHAIADVDVGVFLSGGIDSSLVTAILGDVSERRPKSFTVAFKHPTYNEAGFARDVARHLGTEHCEIELDQTECLTQMDEIMHYHDEPFADASFLPTYLISREARKHVKVCLSGDGGDELFAGYNRYISGARAYRWKQSMPEVVNAGLAHILTALPGDFYDKVYGFAAGLRKPGKAGQKDIGDKIRKIAQILNSGSAADCYDELMAFWRSPPLLDWQGQDLNKYREFSSSFEQHFITTAMFADQGNYLVSDNLFKVDRAAMANSMEVRLPLLDRRIVEYANGLGLPYKYSQGQSKWMLRQVLYQHVPQSLIDRPKMGFSVPLGDWFKNELRSSLEGCISRIGEDDEIGLDYNMISGVMNEHFSGIRNNANRLWAVYSYVEWVNRNKDYIQ
jgi:asparagine synthase (glutamine-hydrolysing)